MDIALWVSMFDRRDCCHLWLEVYLTRPTAIQHVPTYSKYVLYLYNIYNIYILMIFSPGTKIYFVPLIISDNLTKQYAFFDSQM